MTIFVAEIGGLAVAAFKADDFSEAGEIAGPRSPFAQDATVLEHDGEPLWDGESPIHIREAQEDERARWAASYEAAVRNGEAKDGEDWLIFLATIEERD